MTVSQRIRQGVGSPTALYLSQRVATQDSRQGNCVRRGLSVRGSARSPRLRASTRVLLVEEPSNEQWPGSEGAESPHLGTKNCLYG